MNILVTGAAGYLGTRVVEVLSEQQYAVIGLDLAAPPSHSGWGGTMRWVTGDIRDRSVVKSAARDCDAIVHLAGVVGSPACQANPSLAHDINVGGTASLISATSEEQLIVFASTCSVYGAPPGSMCNEASAISPPTLYTEQKAAGEQMLLRRRRSIILRFVTLFGPSARLRPDLLVHDLCLQALQTGTIALYESQVRRHFLHVHDAARGVLHSLQNARQMLPTPIYNCGDSRVACTKLALARAISRETGCTITVSPGSDADQRYFGVSFAGIAASGYRARIGLSEGVRDTLAALRSIGDGNQRLISEVVNGQPSGGRLTG